MTNRRLQRQPLDSQLFGDTEQEHYSGRVHCPESLRVTLPRQARHRLKNFVTNFHLKLLGVSDPELIVMLPVVPANQVAFLALPGGNMGDLERTMPRLIRNPDSSGAV